MITQAEKERKIKLIGLILIVHAEYGRRQPFENYWDAIIYAMATVKWSKELARVSRQRTIESIPNYEKDVLLRLAKINNPK